MTIRTGLIVFLTAMLLSGALVVVLGLQSSPSRHRPLVKAKPSESTSHEDQDTTIHTPPKMKRDLPSALNRGAFVGSIVGLVAVAFWYRFNSRNTEQPSSKVRVKARVLEGVIWSVILGAVCVTGFVYGWTLSLNQRQSQHLQEQIDAIQEILASKPIYQNVQIDEARSQNGYVYLQGFVETPYQLSLLESELVEIYGEERAKMALEGVRVRE